MVSRYSAGAGVICSVAASMKSVQVTTWFLQMTDPAQLAEAPEPDPELEVRQAELPSPGALAMLYTRRRQRLALDRSRRLDLGPLGANGWGARSSRPGSAWVRGTPAGFAELEHQGDAVELVSFGLLPAFMGRGLGPRLLDAALRRAWTLGPTRVWVHTCSLDGPAALRTYQARGLESSTSGPTTRTLRTSRSSPGRARAAEAVMRWMVDASNVIGTQPDGWWRDRDGATRRLLDDLRAFADGGEDVTVVLDAGPARVGGPRGARWRWRSRRAAAATPPTTRSCAAWPATPTRDRSASSPPTQRSRAARDHARAGRGRRRAPG